MAVTIKDIAKRAGVSYSTVSRALNDVSAGRSENKQKILEIAREMGYIPNQAAIHLKLSRSYTIGLYFSTKLSMFSTVTAGPCCPSIFTSSNIRVSILFA